MRGLSVRIGGALLLIVLISVGSMVLFTNLISNYEYRQYVAHGNMAYAQYLSQNLSEYYERQQSWSGIQQALEGIALSSSQRVIIANEGGVIIADSSALSLGETTGSIGLGEGTAIISASKQVGSLYILSAGQHGSGHGHGIGSGPQDSGMTIIEFDGEQFLNKINTSIWQMGIVAGIVAFTIGVILTRQITHPLHQLSEGVQQVSRGNLSYRVNIKSGDELGMLADSFNSMAADLEKGEKAREQIIADISHELRTPLTVIEGTVNGIMDGVFKPDQEHLRSILDQTALLTRLASDLRDLSLAESGQLKLNPEPADLLELADKIVSRYRIKADQNDIDISVVAEEQIPPVEFDALRIDQVISNLVTNAMRYTPAGGSIVVRLARQPANLVLSVTDTGLGISPQNLPHVFERFYRAENSRSRISGGTGLGLAIVKQMVEAHGGRVWAESQPGTGSTFSFSLPLKFPA